MKEKRYTTPLGTIVYWTNDFISGRRTLVFLPGLTADHKLFDAQVTYFQSDYNIFIWDAPAHGLSRPFELSFSLADIARYLYEILQQEHAYHIMLIGQSFGAYVSQAFMQDFPNMVEGFVSLDSASLQRRYITAAELVMLKHTYWMYYSIPWRWLQKWGSVGVAVSPTARQQMWQFMEDYRKKEYCLLAAYGYRLLAEAIERALPYEITCPAMLVCGEKDMAGSTMRYNRAWSERAGLPLHWIPNCGHNSPSDAPDEVNRLLDEFLAKNSELDC